MSVNTITSPENTASIIGGLTVAALLWIFPHFFGFIGKSVVEEMNKPLINRIDAMEKNLSELNNKILTNTPNPVSTTKATNSRARHAKTLSHFRQRTKDSLAKASAS